MWKLIVRDENDDVILDTDFEYEEDLRGMEKICTDLGHNTTVLRYKDA